MRINFIKTEFNTYIELSGTVIGYFTKRYNGNWFCMFFKEYPITLNELADIYEKMEELNAT
jgi:hypothetical protein